MTNQEKAKEEFTQAYIKYFKRLMEIKAIKIPVGILDGHNRETKELAVKLFEEKEKIKKKYNVDKIDFYYEDARKIHLKFLKNRKLIGGWKNCWNILSSKKFFLVGTVLSL